MGKRDLTPEEQNRDKDWYYRLYELREKCFGGFFYGMHEKNTFDDTPEERETFYQKLWDHGGFRFWLGNYKDVSNSSISIETSSQHANEKDAY